MRWLVISEPKLRQLIREEVRRENVSSAARALDAWDGCETVTFSPLDGGPPEQLKWREPPQSGGRSHEA